MRRDCVLEGDCVAVLAGLPPQSIDAVVTSPPYAQQRAAFYDGPAEADYPAWTVAWMEAVRSVLVPTGSVLLNIREHVRDGQMSDYVHRTRLALRAAGWTECDELIWLKRDGMPVGHAGRPRRSWERLLWFAPTRRPWCDPRANGQDSAHLGVNWRLRTANARQWVAGWTDSYGAGRARSRDYADIPVSTAPDGSRHPAAFPPALAGWMLRFVCPPGGTVLDPFAGSGTTALACLDEGRHYILIEKDARYVALATERIAAAHAPLALAP